MTTTQTPEQTSPGAGHREDMTARTHDARDSSGRARVTRMMPDGTRKNVWVTEPAAEVDLDLTTPEEAAEAAWAETQARQVPGTATLAEAMQGQMFAEMPVPANASYDVLSLVAVEDPINDTDEPLVFAAAGIKVDFESEAAKRLAIPGDEASHWLDEHRDDIVDYFYVEHHKATVLEDAAWSENRVDFYSKMPEGAYREMTVKDLHEVVAHTPGLDEFGKAKNGPGAVLDGLFRRLANKAA
jgi:hypothetical protein